MNRFKFKTSGNYQSIQRNLWNVLQINKGKAERSQDVTGWTFGNLTFNMVFKCQMSFYVTMVSFQMALPMNKWANIVMDDG